jgi:hypothetical protein
MARRLLVPPLFDLTLAPELAPDDELLDLNAAFVARLTGEAHLRDLATRYATERHDSDGDRAQAATKALFARAAETVLARGRHDAGRLRAVSVALRLSGENDPALRLAGDDVELLDGTTEAGPDVLLAAARTSLWEPETEHARTWARGHRVHLLIETDQQLPAAARLIEAIGPERTVLCGRFATEHAQALRALGPFTRAADIEEWAPSWQLRPQWTTDGEPVNWVRRAAAWRPAEPWAGWLEPQEAARLPEEAWSHCRGAALTVARLESWARVTGTQGTPVDLEHVLKLAGPKRLAVELLVGAPGVSAKETTRAARRLVTGPGPRLAGFSPFRLPAARGRTTPDTWDGLPLTRAAAPHHDLPRWDPFDAPGTLGRPERTALINALTEEFAAHTDLFPGRFAGSAARAHEPEPSWEPSATVVHEEGPEPNSPGPFVVNLRSGGAFRLHPRLAPVVKRLASGDTTVLDRLTPTVRTKLSGQLVRTGVMRRPQ